MEIRAIRMTEEDIRGKYCPQLSIGENLVSCLGRGCVSFTVTGMHEEAEVTVVADAEKFDSIQADKKLLLENNLHEVFISGTTWKKKIIHENSTYVLVDNHELNVNNSGHVAKYNAILAIKTSSGAQSCYGYCHLNMKDDTIIVG